MSILNKIAGSEVDRLIGNVAPKFKKKLDSATNKIFHQLGVIKNVLEYQDISGEQKLKGNPNKRLIGEPSKVQENKQSLSPLMGVSEFKLVDSPLKSLRNGEKPQGIDLIHEYDKYDKQSINIQDKTSGLYNNTNPNQKLNDSDNIYPILDYFNAVKLDSLNSFHRGVTPVYADQNLGTNLIESLWPGSRGKSLIRLPPEANKALRNLNNIIEDPTKGIINAIGEYQTEILKGVDWSAKKIKQWRDNRLAKKEIAKLKDQPITPITAGLKKLDVDSNGIYDSPDNSMEDFLKSYEEYQDKMSEPFRNKDDNDPVTGDAKKSKNRREIPRYIGEYPTFKGYKSVQGIEVWNSYLWDIKMTPHRPGNSPHIHPPSPPANSNGFIPVTSFELSDSSITPFSVELFGGSSFMIPENESFQRSIRMNVLDVLRYQSGKGRRVWKEWMAEYKKHMVEDYKVTPYKNCCMEITIYILDTRSAVVYSRTYLGILMTPETSASGSGFGNEEYTLDFSIVGEVTDDNNVNLWA